MVSIYASLTGVQVNYQAVGSGAGITAITNNTVDFGASDAIMTSAQVRPHKLLMVPAHIPYNDGSGSDSL